MARKLLLSLAAAAVFAGGAAAASRDAGHSDELSRGKAVYVAQGCYLCHGYAGQGSIASGPALVRLPFDDNGFIQYLCHPAGVMPAFSSVTLSAEDAAALLAYVRALPPGRPAAQIPLLASYVSGADARAAEPAARRLASGAAGPATSTSEGRRLYLANCSACHGAERQGVVGPSLQEVGAKYSDAQVLHILLAPPPGMPKLSPQPLSEEDMRKIVAYIRMKD